MDLKTLAEEINKLTSDEWKELSNILREEWGVYSNFSIVSYEEVQNVGHNDALFSLILKDTGKNKLAVCKLTKEYCRLFLKEAKVLIDSAPVVLKSGLSEYDANIDRATFEEEGATMEIVPIMGSTLGFYSQYPNASIGSDKTEFSVRLKSTGLAKLAVLKEVKDILQIGLKEAKDIIDSLPTVLIETTSLTEAIKIKDALVSLGAEAELI